MNIAEGQQVRLKTARAAAYGFDAKTVYTVIRTYTHPGYKTVWVKLTGGDLEIMSVKASELRP